MKSLKFTLLIISIFGLVFSLVPQAYATGGPAETDPCCLAINPGSGALALKGTLAMVYDPSINNVDVTLRLERSGNQAFFRLNINLNLLGKTDNQILCYLFDPCNSNDPDMQPRVFNFVKEILETFFTGMTPYNTKAGHHTFFGFRLSGNFLL